MSTKTPVAKDNITLMNAVRATLSDTWQERIPVITQENYARWGLAIASDDYTLIRNEFIDALVNKIAKTIIRDKMIRNKLAPFKTGEFTLGDTIEEIFVDIVTAHAYRADLAEDQFEKFKPNVDAYFHRRNREDYYPITVQEKTMRKAFVTEGGIARLVEVIISKLYSSANYDEWLFMKQMFYTYRNQTDFPLLPDQFQNVPMPVDEDSGKAFYRALKGVAYDLSFANRAYNPKGVMTMSEGEDLALFVRADVLPVLEVDVLASAFNMGQVTSGTPPIIAVDNFGTGPTGTEMNDIIAVACDRNWFMIYDNLMTMRTAENARGLYINYYLHIWQTFAASFYANAVFLKVT